MIKYVPNIIVPKQPSETPSPPLVSIILPCYNGGSFLAEAIVSCLQQTYRPIEIVIVDDGSTDNSLEIIKSYGNAITWETGPNRGPSAARNRGFELSNGKYIQYLDADDYLMPYKLARQVSFLEEETKVDVVYGDWRMLHSIFEGQWQYGNVITFGAAVDIKAGLLTHAWLHTGSPLFRRDIVCRSGGWDENIRNAEEKDFQFAVAMAGGVFQYQQLCGYVYRRYGPVTLSTSPNTRWVENAYMVFKKMEAKLRNAEQLMDHYREALAISYYSIARRYYETDLAEYQRALAHARRVCPGFQPRQSRLYNLLQAVVGFDTAQRVASYKRWLARQIGLQAAWKKL